MVKADRIQTHTARPEDFSSTINHSQRNVNDDIQRTHHYHERIYEQKEDVWQF
jgi:hypothetical protein